MSNPSYCEIRRKRLREYRAKCSTMEKPVDGMQCCYRCKQDKPLSEFYKDKGVPTGRATTCKNCVNKKNSDNYYSSHWGIDDVIIKQKLESQNGKCVICGQENKLVLDHNHDTHVIRDFLCNFCNTGLGYLKNNESIIANAAEYLKRHRESPSDLKADLRLKHKRGWENAPAKIQRRKASAEWAKKQPRYHVGDPL